MRKPGSSFVTPVLFTLLTFMPAFGAQWQASVGAQSPDKARQVLAFLPNELWIHAGDSVLWTVNADEIHTITFLKAGQPRPLFVGGCSYPPAPPQFTFGGASFDGSTCVSTPPMAAGQTFTITFPAVGNYKLVCLVHSDMNGTVHVLDPSVPLPHDQSYYDKKAAQDAQDLLADLNQMNQMNHQSDSANAVVTGGGKTLANGGGRNTISLMRFAHPEMMIHAGDTVEWTNVDPVTPHTITFGTEPPNLIPPSASVTVDADGALHATVSLTSDNVHSGLIGSAPQDRPFLPQSPTGVTRFRVTFPNPGVYPYVCSLHDDLGMAGRIIVLP
jgi:plastocyanin